MLTIYLCFLAGGAVLPLISFILGSLGNGVDTDVDVDIDVDTDLGMGGDVDTDIGADIGAEPGLNVATGADTMISVGVFPTSLLAVSTLALTFGAVGGIMTFAGNGRVITFVIAILSGYVASVIVQTIIKSLKKAQTRSSGIDENELLLYDGTIIDTILPGQLGSVSFVTLKDERVSYPARCADETLRLETGKVVKAKEIQSGVFIVEPKNKYE